MDWKCSDEWIEILLSCLTGHQYVCLICIITAYLLEKCKVICYAYRTSSRVTFACLVTLLGMNVPAHRFGRMVSLFLYTEICWSSPLQDLHFFHLAWSQQQLHWCPALLLYQTHCSCMVHRHSPLASRFQLHFKFSTIATSFCAISISWGFD